MTPVTAPVVRPVWVAIWPAVRPPLFSIALRHSRSVRLMPRRSAARLSNALSWLPLVRKAVTSSSTSCCLRVDDMISYLLRYSLTKILATEGKGRTMTEMAMRLELIQVPVSDVDRAKAFYVDQVGFNA